MHARPRKGVVDSPPLTAAPAKPKGKKATKAEKKRNEAGKKKENQPVLRAGQLDC